MANRKNITEQPSPQANSRYPSERKKPGDKRDSSRQAWELGNEVGWGVLGIRLRSRNEKTTKKCKTYVKPAFMIV